MPTREGTFIDYTVEGNLLYADGGSQPRTRLPYAAVHVVADALADTTPVSPAAIDSGPHGD